MSPPRTAACRRRPSGSGACAGCGSPRAGGIDQMPYVVVGANFVLRLRDRICLLILKPKRVVAVLRLPLPLTASVAVSGTALCQFSELVPYEFQTCSERALQGPPCAPGRRCGVRRCRRPSPGREVPGSCTRTQPCFPPSKPAPACRTARRRRSGRGPRPWGMRRKSRASRRHSRIPFPFPMAASP